MAINSGTVSVNIQAAQTAAIGIASTLYRPQVSISRTYTNGTAAETEADLIGSYRATMTTGTPLEVDLRGGELIDGNSTGIDPAEAVAFALLAGEDNTDPVTVTTSGVNGWAAAVDGVVTLPPGGFAVFGVPEGYAITAGTADLISCEGTTGDTLDILILGRSA